MKRVAAGDGAAFARLFDQHAASVLGLLHRLLGRRSRAEEVLQETFLQVWEQGSRYDPDRSTVRGWLLMIARSRALDQIRHGTARRRREDGFAGGDERAGLVHPTGTAGLEAAERRERVASALDGLPPEQRECIELAYFGGLTQTQIAERVGAPLGTVKSRILLGMKKLRTILEST